jgi:hypothetical protein
MSDNIKEWWMEVSWVLFVKFELPSETVAGIIIGMNFIHPERLLIEGMESQGKPY